MVDFILFIVMNKLCDFKQVIQTFAAELGIKVELVSQKREPKEKELSENSGVFFDWIISVKTSDGIYNFFQCYYPSPQPLLKPQF